MKNKMVLLSIKGKYADQILSNIKHYEYRRKIPVLQPPFILLLNVSREIVGSCIVNKIHTLPIDELIERTVDRTPQTKEGLLKYYAELDYGSAMEISEPIKESKTIKIIDMPIIQNYCYIEKPPSKWDRIWNRFEHRLGKHPVYKQLELF